MLLKFLPLGFYRQHHYQRPVNYYQYWECIQASHWILFGPSLCIRLKVHHRLAEADYLPNFRNCLKLSPFYHPQWRYFSYTKSTHFCMYQLVLRNFLVFPGIDNGRIFISESIQVLWFFLRLYYRIDVSSMIFERFLQILGKDPWILPNCIL